MRDPLRGVGLFQSAPFKDQTELHKRRHRVWYLCDVEEVDRWKTIF